MQFNVKANYGQKQLINSTDFLLSVSEFAQVDDIWHTQNLGVPFNRLYLITSGGAHLWAGGREYEMKPGMAYLLPAGLPCSYSCPEKLEQLCFHFNWFRPDRYDLLWGSSQIGCWPIPEDLSRELVRCQAGSSYLDAATIHQWILSIATVFMRETGMGQDSSVGYSELVADTIAYIRDNLSARLRLEDLANRTFASKTQLRMKFHRETGITLGRYIDEQLLMEAQRRLCQTEDTIGTISRELGFCDQFYFSRRFTQLCGVTPQVYRQNARQVFLGTKNRPKA